jgi:hypothetical protein
MDVLIPIGAVLLAAAVLVLRRLRRRPGCPRCEQ